MAEGSAVDIVGEGRDVLLLPALSSISTRAEMRPLVNRLSAGYRCIIPDWPGFGDGPRAAISLTPDALTSFLVEFIRQAIRAPAIGIAAGRAAPYLLAAAHQLPGVFDRLVLVVSTWRGPLPAAIGDHRRASFEKLRKLVEAPVLGPMLYGVNVSRPIVAKMMRAHVYADRAACDRCRPRREDDRHAAAASAFRHRRVRHRRPGPCPDERGIPRPFPA